MSNEETIVLDCGSGTIKAGFSNQTIPLCVFSSVLGKTRTINNQSNVRSDSLNITDNDIVFGNDALRKRGLLSLRYPIEHGIIVNWDDMEKLLQHTFYDELRTDPKDQSVFLSEAALNPRANREKSAEIMFETFDIKSMCMASQSILALYTTGRTSGVVVESGEGVTHVVPIYEGYSIPQAILRLDIGGRDVTDYVVKLLAEKGNTFFTAAEREVIRRLKEKCCYVSQNYDREIDECEMNVDDNNKYFYELPDGNQIELGSERFRCAEILFQPKLINSEQDGFTKLINESIMKTEVDIRRLFWNNIVLCGGNTMFDGMQSRLQNELTKISPNSITPKVIALDDRKYCVWRGAAIISDLSVFKENWMTKKDYSENGTQRIHDITPF